MKPRKVIYYGLPVLGLLFCLWYIKIATFDIVYSDYIRIVNKYLPDVWAPENFFRPDVLTRIPINYLERPLNVALFHYSTTFEMALGAGGLFLSAVVLGYYCDKKQVGIGWFFLLMFITFGLDKWEMLTNGTGWVHFLAFACFYFHYLLFDQVLYGNAKSWKYRLLLILPAIITLGIAGPYCAIYSAVMILAYGAVWITGILQKRKPGARRLPMDWKFCLAGIISVLIPLLLYMWSDSYAIEDHDGAIKIGLVQMFLQDPGFFPQFLLRSMASMVVGEETLNELKGAGIFNDVLEQLLGVFLGGGYLLALWLNVKERLYQKTLVPLMLLFAGMGNHCIVLISRYIFAKTSYGMSSRYALQYQAGVLGILLTFALVWRLKDTVKAVVRGLAVAFCAMMIVGHGYTNYRELQKAPYREEYGIHIGEAALQYEILSDDEIRETFDYRKGRKESSADVRRALRILKENHLNIFSTVEY